MNKLANALDKLSRAQAAVIPKATFKAPNFNNERDLETFLKQFQ